MMKIFPNFSRPDVIFATIWLLVLAVYVPLPTVITPPLRPEVQAMLLFNIVAGPIFYFLIRRSVGRRLGPRPDITRPVIDAADQAVLRRFMFIMMGLWITIFVLGIIVSGGLPIVWYLTGDTREYADFGIPTVSGLGDMFRSFGATLCVLLFVVSQRRVYILLWLIHLLPSIAQVSRGGIAVFVFQSLCMMLMIQRLKLRQTLIAATIMVFAVAMFVLLGMLRGIQMAATDYGGVDRYFGALPVGFYWIWSYVASPLGNVAYAATLGLHPDYTPQYSLVYLVPTVIRKLLITGPVYTPLATDELNATSIYAPLFMDFGPVGAAALITLFIIFVSYVHVMARRGNLFYLMMYPALYASLGLSFFHIFALTPGVIAVPFLCLWFKRYVENRHSPTPTGAVALA